MASGRNSNLNSQPSRIVAAISLYYSKSQLSVVMFYVRPGFPIQSVTVDSHHAEALDLATDMSMFRSHTVPIPDAFDSNVVETLDLTAVPSSSISPESHMITIVDTSQFEVDIESLPVQQAVAGLLACSRR